MSLNHICTILLYPLKQFLVLLESGSTELNCSTADDTSPEQRESRTSLKLLAVFILHPRMSFTFLSRRSHCCGHPVVHQDSQIFFHRALSSRSASNTGLFSPRFGALHMPLLNSIKLFSAQLSILSRSPPYLNKLRSPLLQFPRGNNSQVTSGLIHFKPGYRLGI